MFDALKGWVLRFAKVPAEPEPPTGSPGSVRVFRAAANYWKYLLVGWGFKQISGAVALVVFLSLTSVWQRAAEDPRPKATAPEAATSPSPGDEPTAQRKGDVKPRSGRGRRYLKQFLVAGWLHDLELIGLGFFLLQMPFSLAAARLEYEMRWYMVTDRSMRLREGIFRVREMTLTFANIQNITIRQGPLQRLLGISDVVVRTAGGGGSGEAHGHGAQDQVESMHTGVLRAVDNAESVRDLILDRLRRLRDAGLGDPDDRHHAAVAAPGDGAVALGVAARELLVEARALRSAL